MSTKLEVALALLSMVVPLLFASIIADLTQRAAIRIVLALGVIAASTSLWGIEGFSIAAFLCACIALLEPYASGLLAPRISPASPATLRRVMLDHQMRDWCRAMLQRQGWKIVSARNDRAVNLSVAKDDNTVHLYCAGFSTVLSDRLLSELSRFARGAGAPVVLLLPTPITEVVRARCRELCVVPLSWRELDALARVERPKSAPTGQRHAGMLPV